MPRYSRAKIGGRTGGRIFRDCMMESKASGAPSIASRSSGDMASRHRRRDHARTRDVRFRARLVEFPASARKMAGNCGMSLKGRRAARDADSLPASGQTAKR
eukprot:scaffold146748_cov32-Tisochrysis_lutea.AAC.5